MLETNKIHNGDCLDLMKEIPDKSIDMILCDLPYGTTACKWDTIIPFEPLWEQYKRIIKDNGAIVLFGSEPFSSMLRVSNLKNFKYDWIWQKDKGANFALSRKQPLKKHEIISVFYTKQPFYDYRDKELDKPIIRVLPKNKNGAVDFNGEKYNLNKDGTRKTTTYTHETKKSVLYFKRESQAYESFHPTQKPVALMEYLIKTYTNENELVLDNCSGSGTTAIACVNTNRRFICIEKDKEFYEASCRRLEEAQKLKEMEII